MSLSSSRTVAFGLSLAQHDFDIHDPVGEEDITLLYFQNDLEEVEVVGEEAAVVEVVEVPPASEQYKAAAKLAAGERHKLEGEEAVPVVELAESLSNFQLEVDFQLLDAGTENHPTLKRGFQFVG